jgi:hypothetical protein
MKPLKKKKNWGLPKKKSVSRNPMPQLFNTMDNSNYRKSFAIPKEPRFIPAQR